MAAAWNRLALAAGGSILLTGIVMAPAAAYPPGTAMTITAGNGQIVIANGQPGCTVTVQGPNFSRSTTIDSDGMAVINANLPDGEDLEATVSGKGCAAESASGVVSNSGGGGGGGGGGGNGGGGGDTPSRTGSDTVLGLLAGLGAVGVGGGLVVAARRKKA